MSDEHTSHDKREHARLEREHEQKKRDAEKAAQDARSSMITLVLVLLLFIAFAAGAVYLFTHKPAMYVDHEVHWHAMFDIEICGEHKELPCAHKGAGLVHGEQFCGETLMHHHFDNTMHIEGIIVKKEDIALGKFFDLIGVPFDKDKLLDAKNGDLCENKPGVVKMYVNNIPSNAFRDYIPAATPDGHNQIIKLVFEPADGMMNDRPIDSALPTPKPPATIDKSTVTDSSVGETPFAPADFNDTEPTTNATSANNTGAHANP